MAQHGRLQRTAEGLAEALANIDHWSHYVLPRQFADPAGWELQNMPRIGRLMIEAALSRQETRGAQSVSDFPDADEPIGSGTSLFAAKTLYFFALIAAWAAARRAMGTRKGEQLT